MNITIFTDGSFHIKTKTGGWGTVIRCTTSTGSMIEWQDYGGIPDATSSGHTEVMGVLQALKVLPDKCNVVLHCDNQYALKSLVKDGNGHISMMLGRVNYTGWIRGWKNNGWKTTNGPVKNQELWVEVMKECHRLLSNGSSMEFKWIKGHSNNEGNDLADELASLGAKSV